MAMDGRGFFGEDQITQLVNVLRFWERWSFSMDSEEQKKQHWVIKAQTALKPAQASQRFVIRRRMYL